MREHLDAFEADYRVQFPSDVWKTDLRLRDQAQHRRSEIERDLFYVEGLAAASGGVLLVATASRVPMTGRERAAREWLYHRLCELWLDHFQAAPPGFRRSACCARPLVNFILAAMRQIMPRRRVAESGNGARRHHPPAQGTREPQRKTRKLSRGEAARGFDPRR